MKKDETIIEILTRHYKPVNSSDYLLLSDIEDDIELFVFEALKSEKEEVTKEIEKMKKWQVMNMPNPQKEEEFNFEVQKYNRIIDDIIEKIKGL